MYGYNKNIISYSRNIVTYITQLAKITSECILKYLPNIREVHFGSYSEVFWKHILLYGHIRFSEVLLECFHGSCPHSLR